jgi:hypothetical protein
MSDKPIAFETASYRHIDGNGTLRQFRAGSDGEALRRFREWVGATADQIERWNGEQYVKLSED